MKMQSEIAFFHLLDGSGLIHYHFFIMCEKTNTSFEVDYCKECGSKVFIKNATRSEKGIFEKVAGVVERQQELLIQDIQDEKRKKIEYQMRLYEEKKVKKENRSKWWQDNYWKIGIFVIVLFILSIDKNIMKI